MSHTRILSTLLLLTASGLFHSCQVLTPSLDEQVLSVQALRADLESEWSKVGVSVQSVESEVAEFSTNSIDPAVFDIGLVTAALKASETRVREGNARIEEVSTTIPLGSALDLAVDRVDKVTGTEVEALYAAGVNIINTLRGDLPDTISDLVTKAAESVVQAGQDKVEAQSTLEIAERNPLTSQEELVALRGRYADFERELDILQGLAKTVTSDAEGYSSRIEVLLDVFDSER